MEYIPKKHKISIFLRALPLVLLIALIVFAGTRFAVLFRLIPAVILVFIVFTEIIIEGIVSDHIYVLNGASLGIYRRFGKHETKVFDLDLRFAIEAAPYSEIKKRKEKIKPAPRRRYCLCGAPLKRSFALIYEPDKRRHVLFIAPDETFAEALKNAVASYSVGNDSPV